MKGDSIMKFRFLALLLTALLVLPLGAEKIASLPDLAKPTAMEIHEGKLYIMDSDCIHIYQMEPLQKIHTFGRPGEGPGEFNSSPIIKFFADSMYVFTMGKSMRFQKDGTFIDQTRVPFLYFYMYFPFYPVGDRLVGLPLDLSQGPDNAVHICTLYDASFKPIKEFYRGPPPSVPLPPRRDAAPKNVDIHILPHRIGVGTTRDKIFVGDTRKGMVIAVFDTEGQPLYEIKKDIAPLKVPKSFKDQTWREIKAGPNYEVDKGRFNYIIADIFPAFSTFKVKEDRIYVTTHAEKDGRYEFITMDLTGNILTRDYVFPYDPLERLLLPVFTTYETQYDIAGDSIYYLKLDEAAGVYALHREKITP
jgi:hypothetical protein